jgi:hypothetical protein
MGKMDCRALLAMTGKDSSLRPPLLRHCEARSDVAIHVGVRRWIPAFAGMTEEGGDGGLFWGFLYRFKSR